ncbi:MAG: tRNA 4-thiouridine(8) synthase ThiI [Pseudomonadota bacterium]
MAAKGKTRALSLLSGGLDSLLAVRALQEQGIEVIGITFTSPFFGSANAEQGAVQLGIELIIQDITDDHLPVVKNPPHGYGKCLNPCIDCHALMIRKAGEVMRRDGFDLITTGEVLGERPMSQNMQALGTVERDSGCKGFLLRPLSAKLLLPTWPEIEGQVDREQLFAIEGRSRKPQMVLAKRFGIKSYVQPAGGCLLTDPAFCARLSELWGANPDASVEDIRLLRLGRHFRLPSGAKAIVGRDMNDNERIAAKAVSGTALLSAESVPGPVVLLVEGSGREDIEIAARLCASFSDHGEGEVGMDVQSGSGTERIAVHPSPRSEFDVMRI